MDKIMLIRPSKDLETKAIDYKNEHFKYGEWEINGIDLFDKIGDYDKWLAKVTLQANKEIIRPNLIPADTFFALREHDKKIIGVIDLRHKLSVFLQNYGHIGYSVRPFERNKGYATEMLRQVLEIARQAGMNEIQLSCKRNNIPSVKTITKNGGVYERSFDYSGETADVYIVKL